MIQEIFVYLVIGAVILKVGYSLWKSLTTKDKSLCGGCGSCDIKSELKKKGKLIYEVPSPHPKFPHKAGSLKYSPER